MFMDPCNPYKIIQNNHQSSRQFNRGGKRKIQEQLSMLIHIYSATQILPILYFIKKKGIFLTYFGQQHIFFMKYMTRSHGVSMAKHNNKHLNRSY